MDGFICLKLAPNLDKDRRCVMGFRSGGGGLKGGGQCAAFFYCSIVNIWVCYCNIVVNVWFCTRACGGGVYNQSCRIATHPDIDRISTALHGSRRCCPLGMESYSRRGKFAERCKTRMCLLYT